MEWTAPASNGGAAITGYEVSRDNGANWVTAANDTWHIFTGLQDGQRYTFKVRAVNLAGQGAEASTTATPGIETPHTGFSDMTGQLALAIVFVVFSAGLWGYVIRRKLGKS